MWIITSAVWCLKQADCCLRSALTALHLRSRPLSFSCGVQSCYSHMVSICLSATGRTVARSVILKRHLSFLWRAGDYLCSALALLSAPLSPGAPLLKRHTEGFTCQFKMFLCRRSSVKSCWGGRKDLSSGFRLNNHISQWNIGLYFSDPFLLRFFFRTDIIVHCNSIA